MTRVGRVAFPVTDIYLREALLRCGDYCYGEMMTYRSIVERGMSVLDIGANIGLMSLLFSSLVGSTGSVFAFEPSVFAAGLLRHNLAANGCGNVDVRRVAMSSQPGEVSFLNPDVANIPHLNFGALSFASGEEPIPGSLVPTPVTTIDGLDLAHCDFIKIDVEGFEASVFEGGWRTIRKFLPFLSVEAGDADTDLSWSTELLGLGYRISVLSFRIYSSPNFKRAPIDDLSRVVCANAIALPPGRDPDRYFGKAPRVDIFSEDELRARCRKFSQHEPQR
ncbi:FkbM family methyltransferase [Nisaea acidiphila]|uniref:FkbM family methyltransferase n=1 Tax=Nisaea acidiphila TaxID=1862145 RepID=A0A9J7AYH0_9PROT|nr:FkbM family methyltransferase [Nisaea acidiphila]UUX51316.1 FkbM family methyltransferase [Nisaea acidiphila]